MFCSTSYKISFVVVLILLQIHLEQNSNLICSCYSCFLSNYPNSCRDQFLIYFWTDKLALRVCQARCADPVIQKLQEVLNREAVHWQENNLARWDVSLISSTSWVKRNHQEREPVFMLSTIMVKQYMSSVFEKCYIYFWGRVVSQYVW